MKVYVYPADAEGCGYHRLIWPSEVLQAQGHDVTIVMPKDRKVQIFEMGGQVAATDIPRDADVAVFQRTTHRLIIGMIQNLRRRGVAVVVDVDDDLGAITPGNPAYWALHPRGEREDHMHSWRNLVTACQEASLVTVSAPALLDVYARHGRGVVLHNYLASHYFGHERRDSDRVGYPGALHSHTDDLRVVGPAVARLVREGVRFIVAGDPTGTGKAFMLEDDPESVGIVPLARWPRALGVMGVGIAPLADTKFNASKSWLKILELSAVGVPWVASPRAEYVRFHGLGGGGLLVDRPKDWYRTVRQLVDDAGLRAGLSSQAQAVAAQLRLEDHAWRWAEAWAAAGASKHSAPPAVSRTERREMRTGTGRPG